MAYDPLSLAAMAAIAAGIALGLSKRIPALGALGMANVIVFALMIFAPDGDCGVGTNQMQCDLGLSGPALAAGEPAALLQVITSMFIHGDGWHLFGNMLVLFAFALPFEERVGARVLTVIYLVTGVGGALAQSVTDWGGIDLMLGASGAVFGIIGAFAAAFPRLVVPLPLPLLFIMIWVRMQVWKAAVAFAGIQVVFQFMSGYGGMASSVAYMAHLGGLAAGLPLGLWYVRRKAREADPMRPVRTPIPVERLRPFASDRSAKNALEHMEQNKDQGDVFRAWQERFLQHAACPTCSGQVAPRGSSMRCVNGHHFDLRRSDLGIDGARPT